MQRQAMHMTLPVPEQDPHRSTPWLRVLEPAWLMSGLLPSTQMPKGASGNRRLGTRNEASAYKSD